MVAFVFEAKGVPLTLRVRSAGDVALTVKLMVAGLSRRVDVASFENVMPKPAGSTSTRMSPLVLVFPSFDPSELRNTIAIFVMCSEGLVTLKNVRRLPRSSV